MSAACHDFSRTLTDHTMAHFASCRRRWSSLLALALTAASACSEVGPTAAQPSEVASAAPRSSDGVLSKDASVTVVREHGYIVRTVAGVERQRFLEQSASGGWLRRDSNSTYTATYEGERAGAPNPTIIRTFADGRRARIEQTPQGLMLEEFNADGRLYSRRFSSNAEMEQALEQRSALTFEYFCEGNNGCDITSCNGNEECEASGPSCVAHWFVYKAASLFEATNWGLYNAAAAARAAAWESYQLTGSQAAYDMFLGAMAAEDLAYVNWQIAFNLWYDARAIYRACMGL
jgi:hypothetical protein